MAQMEVGLIGLGLMGRGIGKNLLKKGFALTVYDVDKAAVERLVAQGAVAVNSPREVGERSAVTITVLPDGPDVEATVLGPNGVLSGARPGAIIVDCSTIDPGISQKVGAAVREAGCRFVDAAMSRSSKEAEEGRLVFMVGAEPDDYETVLPVLRAAGTDIFHCGGPSTGITVKVINNLLATAIAAADIEALLLGAKAGVSMDVMMRVLTATGANNAMLGSVISNEVLTGNYEPGFKLRLAHKDVGLAHSLAARLGIPLLVLGPARQLYAMAMGRGEGERSYTVIADLLQKALGVRLAR
jgi:4-hydroxybutyrate dehydrogenase/sulfolactaldehyde 3-reductase